MGFARAKISAGANNHHLGISPPKNRNKVLFQENNDITNNTSSSRVVDETPIRTVSALDQMVS